MHLGMLGIRTACTSIARVTETSTKFMIWVTEPWYCNMARVEPYGMELIKSLTTQTIISRGVCYKALLPYRQPSARAHFAPGADA